MLATEVKEGGQNLSGGQRQMVAPAPAADALLAGLKAVNQADSV